MNIFFLAEKPEVAAVYHCDKHVVKMIVETAQLLSTAHRVLDGDLYIDASSGRRIKRWRLPDNLEHTLYKASHVNHPSAIWVRECNRNYYWAYDLMTCLCSEYTFRYGKTHKSSQLLPALSVPPCNIPKTENMSVPRLAMPEPYKKSISTMSQAVKAYRHYYHFKRDSGISMKWSNPRMDPSWMSNKDLIEQVA